MLRWVMEGDTGHDGGMLGVVMETMMKGVMVVMEGHPGLMVGCWGVIRGMVRYWGGG